MPLPDCVYYKVLNSYDSIVNLYRRAFINDLDIIAFDTVEVLENTTQIYIIDWIIQRFQLIPLKQSGVNIGINTTIMIQNTEDKYKLFTINDIVKSGQLKESYFFPESLNIPLLDMPPYSRIVLTLKCTKKGSGKDHAMYKGIHAWYYEFHEGDKSYPIHEKKEFNKLDELEVATFDKCKCKYSDCIPKNYVFCIEPIYKLTVDEAVENIVDKVGEQIDQAKFIFENTESSNKTSLEIHCQLDHGILNFIRQGIYLQMANEYPDFGPNDFMIMYDQPHKLKKDMVFWFVNTKKSMDESRQMIVKFLDKY